MSMILIVEWTGYKVKDNASVEKLTEQVKESPIWKVSPATMAVMGLAALPIISFLFIMLIGLSPAFLAFLAVEGIKHRWILKINILIHTPIPESHHAYFVIYYTNNK